MCLKTSGSGSGSKTFENSESGSVYDEYGSATLIIRKQRQIFFYLAPMVLTTLTVSSLQIVRIFADIDFAHTNNYILPPSTGMIFSK